MSLNPVVTPLPDGKIKMTWTPDLTGLGYRFYRDGVAVSIGTKPSQASTRFAAETDGRSHRYGLRTLGEVGPLEAAEYPPPVVEPPPPAPGLSPIGWLKNAWPAWWPPTNADKYGIAAAYGPAPASFKGISVRYLTAVTCYPAPNDTNGVPAEDAILNDWILRDAAGNPIRRGGQFSSGYVADVGDPGYRQAFCEMAAAKIGAQQGAWIDDSNPRILSLTGGVRPAKYPTDAAYEDALAGFIAFVHAYFKARVPPLLDVWNTAVPQDNTGALVRAWWTRIGPTAGGLCVEGWMTPSATTNIRKVGPEWWNNWDGFRALHGICQAAGCHFFPMNWDRSAQEYALATFLLDWDGATGSCQWNILAESAGYTSRDDPWTAVCDRALALGQPTGPAVKTGGVWKRTYANGTVTVDPVAGTATIT